MTPLDIACYSGYERLLKQLIKIIKDHNPKLLKTLLNPQSKYVSPLHIAIEQDHLAIAKVLIKEGSDVKLKHSKTNLPPLEAAIKYERE